jgi:ABC-type transport system involved in multi-copper enzyme maturation permease subunit
MNIYSIYLWNNNMSKDQKAYPIAIITNVLKVLAVTLFYMYTHFLIAAVCSIWSIEVSLYAARAGMISAPFYLATHIAAVLLTVVMLLPMFEKEGDFDGGETNKVLRLSYYSGLIGLVFGSTKNRVQNAVSAMNQNGYRLHLIHQDDINLVQILGRYLLLIITFGVWTWGRNDLLIFEKNDS